MSQLDHTYLQYSKRRYGYDHDWYEWSMLESRAPLVWPDRKPLAVWINVSLQHFPLDQKGKPFKTPFGMTMPYPDLRHFSLRDYGNRVGIYRFLKFFEANGLPVTYAINASLAGSAPQLIERVCQSAGEIVAHGWDMDHLHSPDLSRDAESELISRSVDVLRAATGKKIQGWLSPARSQSWNTLSLLPEAGLSYCMDWVNDDLPYPVSVETGPLTMLPLNTEVEDSFVMGSNLHSEDEWADQVIDATDFMLKEGRTQNAGRMLGISLHPWLTGQPHRIGCVERVLNHVLAHRDQIWLATAGEIVSTFAEQQKQAAQKP
ncbi:polysaccharide deacetylase family protein [Orrella marina]|uniref:Polysaccharide deacetylase n=1 Tax=Orrella marina TaxID=2163011 RepID=A0A2R4XMJ2_9BURK|nr:polysaccharide deacetylase family protein [Orrella marina]AWB35026.1 polysaccharide deacetylase [Orrella marina]